MAYYNPQQPPIVRVEKNNMATASLVLGIVTLVMAFLPVIGLIAFATGPLALIFGLMARRGLPVGKGSMVAGLITGGVGLLISLVWAVVFTAIMGSAGSTYQDVRERSNQIHRVELIAESAAGTGMVNHGVRGDRITDADAQMPWSRTIEVTGNDWVTMAVHAPASDGLSSVTCRVLVDGNVVDEKTSDGIATCRVSLSTFQR